MNSNLPTTQPDDLMTPQTAVPKENLIKPQSISLAYHGEIVHFSSAEYRQTFSEDPLNSCLASRLLSDK